MPALAVVLRDDSARPEATDPVGLAGSRCRCSSACCFFHHAGSPWKSPSDACVARSSGISCLNLHPCCVKAHVPSCTHLSQYTLLRLGTAGGGADRTMVSIRFWRPWC